jgi:glycosyltransferase involved in cell wall biosynthesis
MMQSLNLAYTLPFPTRSGYDLRVWNICACLSPRIRQTLLCRNQQPVGSDCQEHFRGKGITLRSLHLPAPGRVAKGVKALGFLLSAYPVMMAGWQFAQMRRELARLLAKESFDLIVMEGIWLAAYWPLIERSRAVKILNHFDLEAVSLRRQASVMQPGFQRALYLHDARRMQKLENRIIRKADWVWVTSPREKQILLERDPALPVEVAPNGVDCDAIRPLPAVESRELLFVGSMSHYPNVDAVLYFAREVLPLLRRSIPDAVFRIVGRGTGPDIRELAKLPGVLVTGEVADLRPYYARCAACVVPLRSGGGTRLKILECMAYGRPVISTALGAEGIAIDDGVHFLKADTPAAMVEAIRKTLSQPELSLELVRNARARVEAQYDWKAIAGKMHDRYQDLVSRRAICLQQDGVLCKA